MFGLIRARHTAHIALTVILVLSVLASASGPVAATGAYEPNDDFDTAKSITSGFSGDTRIGPDDQDYYAIDLAEGETVDVTVRNAKDADVSVDLELYGPTGESRNIGEDLSTDISDQTRHRIGYEADESGTYYVLVDGAGGSSDPAASYTIDVVTAQNDRFEPNGVIDNATEITAGTFTDLTLLSGDTDYYAVTLGAGETINATVRNDKDAAFDPNVELVDSSGDRIEIAEELSTQIADRTKYRLGYEVDTAGTYYLVISGSEYDEHDVGYTLDVDVASNDRFEPNGVTDKATEITAGEYGKLTLLSGDTDYYAVTLGAGETINATVRNDKDAAFDPDLTLLDSSGDQVEMATDLSEQVDDRTRYQLGYETDTAGTYYLEVSGNEYDEQHIGYTMNVGVASNDRFEPNGVTDKATEITAGEYGNLSLLSGDTDYYAVTLDTGETINATVRNDKDAEFDPDVTLLDSSGDQVETATDLSEQVDDRTTYRLGYESQTNGTFYLEVSGNEYDEHRVGYTMDVGIGSNDRFEPNGVIGEAAPVSPGTYEDLQILSEERDYYAIDVSADEQLDLTVQHNKDYDMDLEIVDSDDQILASGSDTSDTTSDTANLDVSYTPDSSGTYYIRVDSAMYTEETAPYTLSIEGGQEPTNEQPYTGFSFTYDSKTPNEEFQFDASESYDVDGTIVSYEWDFNGDGTIDTTGSTVSHTFAEPGEYLITMIATDDDGATSSATAFVTVESESTGNGIIDEYDTNGDGIGTSELITAVADWRNGDLTTRNLLQLLESWRSL
ncbi:pre-peptidase C-terminal domain-containing protein [Halopenitus malekzadehii]|uniref:Pre-peptidase C-terminal domain-containing protein n=1 Tax=Halopenitus malekzadehii TaxID=1267564 RepID=A0A1H6J2M0_9EURY|nr:PKD domain-containing protein [Halopenitus malekzadehii]SEH53147.1 pre-peptidase C-terminal domain-containing protein [Halopenitus malekzadehii]